MIWNCRTGADGLRKTRAAMRRVRSAKKVAYSAGQIIGVIRIPAIDLNIQSTRGSATNCSIKASVTFLYTDGLGQYGNTGLAGHRAHRYGALFNRLDELEMDDVGGDYSRRSGL